MKKTSLIILILLSGMALKSFGQKLEENKTDEFTKKLVKRTSWETFVSSLSQNMHFRISNVDDFEVFELRIHLNDILSVDEGKEFMLKMDDGNIITLKTTKDALPCKGCGAVGYRGSNAWGIEMVYPVEKEQIAQLKTHKVVKVRIGTNDGYMEQDIKDKNAEKIKASFNLL